MDAPQHTVPRVTQLPKSNLHEKDLKFVKEMTEYIGTINGRESLQVSIHDSFDSRFKVMMKNPPKMTMDDINQIKMLCAHIISIKVDLKRSCFTVEAWKENKQKIIKKRNRELDEYIELPSTYKLKNVDITDRAQVEGVLKLIVSMTELEFETNVQPNGRDYNLIVSKLEAFEINSLDVILKKFRVFVTDISLDFPKNQLNITIRKSDATFNQIVTLPRKKLRIG
jgi:hypothetical protein